MSRYASQPALPQGDAPRFSGAFPWHAVPNLQAMGAQAQNRASYSRAPQYALATPEGLQKAGLLSRYRTKRAMGGMPAAPVPGPADIPPAPNGPTVPQAPPPAMPGMPADPAQGAMPQDPAQGGAPPLQPPMAEMSAAPLPANPRLNPPRPLDPQDVMQNQAMQSLLGAGQAPPNTPGESIDDELMGIGAKTAWDPEQIEEAAGAIDMVRDWLPSWMRRKKKEEKTAAQDNSQPRFSATGESKGLSYLHKPDHYMQGRDAWKSVGGYFRGRRKSEPDPFLGKHAMDDHFACGGDNEKYEALLAGRKRRQKRADAAFDATPLGQKALQQRALYQQRVANRAPEASFYGDMSVGGPSSSGPGAFPVPRQAPQPAPSIYDGGMSTGGPGPILRSAQHQAQTPTARQPATAAAAPSPASMAVLGSAAAKPAPGPILRQAKHQPSTGGPSGAATAPLGGTSGAKTPLPSFASSTSPGAGPGPIKRQSRHEPAFGKSAGSLRDFGVPLAGVAGGALTSLGASEFDRLIAGRRESPAHASRRRRMMLAGGGAMGGALGLASVLAPRYLNKNAAGLGTDDRRFTTSISSGPDSTETAPTPVQSGLPSVQAQPSQRVDVNTVPTVGTKMAGLTPFADGFLGRCATMGLRRDQVERAIEKVARDYGEDVAGELRDGLEKRAVPWGRMARGAVTAGRNFLAGPGAGALKGQVGGSLGGGMMGAFAGEDMFGQRGTINGPFGMRLSAPGFAAGAMAFNPRLARTAMRAGPGAAQAALRGARGALVGATAGGGADMVAGQLGYEGTGFGRMGAVGGGLAGLGGGVGRALARRAAPGAVRSEIGQGLLHGASTAGRGMNQFTQGVYEPLTQAIASPARAAYNYVAGRPVGGFFAGPATSAAQRAGRLAGGVGVGGLGLGLASNALGQRVQGAVDENIGRVMPAVTQHLADTADRYMGERGLLDRQGRFDPVGGTLHGLAQHLGPAADSILGAMGVDPAAMSPAQKMLLLGGGGLAAGGAMAGSGGLAALGGAGMAAGAIPPFLAALQRQHAQPGGYRNELLNQLQLQGGAG